MCQGTSPNSCTHAQSQPGGVEVSVIAQRSAAREGAARDQAWAGGGEYRYRWDQGVVRAHPDEHRNYLAGFRTDCREGAGGASCRFSAVTSGVLGATFVGSDDLATERWVPSPCGHL
ncbi:MAG: hypothetical protein JWM85_2106 [Acidimicrobiaceae bacterium]|nr:hypothetical protein [Acidimicrobiaceae bacterium]